MFKYFDWFFCLISVVILIYCMWVYLKWVNYMNIFWVEMENRKWFKLRYNDYKKLLINYFKEDYWYIFVNKVFSEKEFFFGYLKFIVYVYLR